jgi:WD40 repeat protein
MWSEADKGWVSGLVDGSIRIWAADRHERSPAARPDRPQEVLAVAWSPGGDRLATGATDGFVRVWRRDGTELHHLRTDTGSAVRSLAWSKDGKALATGSMDGVSRVWDVSGSGPPTGRQLKPDSGAVGVGSTLVAWSADGLFIASGSGNGITHIWDAESGKHRRALPAPPPRRPADGTPKVASLAWSGGQLAVGYERGHVRGFRPLESDIPDADFPAHIESTVWAVAWSPDGRLLATASDDLTARVWKVQLAKAGERHPWVVELRGHTRPIGGMSWSRDGRYLATAALDGTVRVWGDPTPKREVAAMKMLLVFQERNTAARSVAWAPDGKSLAAGWTDGVARIWDGQPLDP